MKSVGKLKKGKKRRRTAVRTMARVMRMTTTSPLSTIRVVSSSATRITSVIKNCHKVEEGGGGKAYPIV